MGFSIAIVYVAYYSFRYHLKTLLKIWRLVKKTRFIILPLFLLLFIFFVIPRLEKSVYSFSRDTGATLFRSLQNKDAVFLIKIHPIFGIGSGMGVAEGITLNLFTKKALLPLEPHSWYLLTALNNGSVSMLVFIMFLIVFISNLIGRKNKNIFTLAGVGVILSTVVAAFLQPFYNMNLVLILTSLAIHDNMTSNYD